MLTTDLHEENKLYPETSTTFTERLERYNPSTGRVWKRYLLHCICSVTQSCLTLCNPMDYSPSGSSVHGIFQARILGVGCHFLPQDIFPTQGSNPSPCISCIGRQILYHTGRQILYHWATWEAPKLSLTVNLNLILKYGYAFRHKNG